MSISKVRFSRCAQVRGAVGRLVAAMGACVDLHGWFSGAVADESLGVGRLRRLVGLGTTRRRRGALGAKTPW